MWTLKTILCLGLSALLADAAGTINAVTFTSTSPGYVMNWTGGATEYHCLYTPDGASSPTYVKGTYGLYGYFEGTVDNSSVATVKYWSILPSTGPSLSEDSGAVIRYAANYANLSGDFGGFLNSWGAVNGTNNTSPTITQLKDQCLWAYDTIDGSKPRTAGYWTASSSSSDEQYWLCDFNTSITYGSYNYTYPPGNDTQGYSVADTFETNSSTISTGFDYDTVGQFAGTNYTFLAVALTADASATNPLQIGGFYCEIDTSSPFQTSLCEASPYTASTASTADSSTCSQFVDPTSPYAAAVSPSPGLSGASQVGPTFALMVVLFCYQVLAL